MPHLSAWSLLGVLALGAPALAADRPVVVELFTSQSCSSCPPAEAVLGGLAATRPDLLPLAFHVTYWDRLGWKDRYSLPAATARQRGYAAGFGADSVYTPQLVVDGARHVVGSDRRAVAAAIAAAEAERAAAPSVALAVRRTADGLAIEVGGGAGTGRLWLVGFDAEQVTAVASGENAGRTLRQANVVRALEAAGTWDGTPARMAAARPAGERAAVLLQAPGGRILAAAVLPAGG